MKADRLDFALWTRALVLGMGRSGTAAARLLRARGVEVVAVDRRAAAALDLGELAADPGVRWQLGADDVSLPRDVDAMVVSPGVPAGHPLWVTARAQGLPVVGEIELAFAALEGPVCAITGSNGKSTTTAMTGHLLAAAGLAVEVCGNIGVALSERVPGPRGRIFVVELSSFQLEAIARFRPHAAAFLNLSPDHLDRHGSLAAYLDAKRRIFANMTADDIAVLNADEPEVAATVVAARRRFFSRQRPIDDGCHLAGDAVVEVAPGARPAALFSPADVPLLGPHNLENAMAAALLARAMGAPVAAIAPALRTFRGLPHRVARVASAGGVDWYDDSKGTNVAATARSLEGFADGSVHVILGGRNKGADLSWIRGIVARKARAAYLIGESAADFARALAGAVPLVEAGTLAAAVERAAAAARPGEVVLLSPACASFDQFRDYVDRGEQFERLARCAAGAAEAAHG
ncbi:MAG: UDP-N-acetylmuramoyl-L-alanine--D-glutamate ligase [Thermoanaerobaculia bacterium]